MRLWYEQRFGFGRGAVFRNGQPHLYLEGLINDPSLTLMGVRSVARLSARSGGVGFVQLADGQQAMIDAKSEATEGSFLDIEIVAEPRGDKLARARVFGVTEGPVRRLSAPQDIVTRLKAQARALIGSDDPEVMTGEDAADHIDTAETQALATVISLGNGADISIEATRALVALDVDLGNAADGLSGNLKSAIRKTNEQAIHETARLLRLSNLAGFVVVDLIGSRHDFDRLKILATEAFGPEAPVISLGGPNRFGTLQLSRPWGAAPHRALTATPVRQARRLLWRAASEARGDGGAMFTLKAPHRVLEVVTQALKDSQDPLSPRLHLKADETAINGDILRLN